MDQPNRWRDQLSGLLTGGRRRVLRLTPEQDRLVRRAASLMGAVPDDFVVEAALSRARTVVDLNAGPSQGREDAFDRFMAGTPLRPGPG